MTNEEIVQGNNIIAEFMGYNVRETGDTTSDKSFGGSVWFLYSKDGVTSDSVFYNSSWDWLMPVVDKIKELKYPINLYQSHIQNTAEIFEMKNDNSIIRESDTKISKPIEVLWRAIIKFIEIYKYKK